MINMGKQILVYSRASEMNVRMNMYKQTDTAGDILGKIVPLYMQMFAFGTSRVEPNAEVELYGR